MANFILQDENAVYYECGYSCDNEIFINAGDERFFITDARYGIEAKSCLKNTHLIVAQGSLIKEARLLFRKLGIDKIKVNPADFSYQDLQELSRDMHFKLDFAPNFSQIKRIIKNADEIAILKKAAKLGAKGFDKIAKKLAKIIKNGDKISERELNFLSAQVLQKNGELGLSFAPITAFNASGAKAHALPTSAVAKKGDLFLLDAGIKYRRYCSDRTRTLELSSKMQMSKDQKFKDSKKNEIYHIVLDAQKAALNAIKPGVLARDVDVAAREVIARAGYAQHFFHSTGHGVGLDIHELPRISKLSKDVLQEGMVFSVEPGIYLEGEFGVRIEDVVVVTKNGYEIL